jgi:hypothetical protein
MALPFCPFLASSWACARLCVQVKPSRFKPHAKQSTDVQAPRRRKPYRHWRCSDALGHFLPGKVPKRRNGVLRIVSRSWPVVPVEVSQTESRGYDGGAVAFEVSTASLPCSDPGSTVPHRSAKRLHSADRAHPGKMPFSVLWFADPPDVRALLFGIGYSQPSPCIRPYGCRGASAAFPIP